MHSGLKSKTKGFLKLYSTMEDAKEFAKQFANREGDVLVALEVDANRAFTEGTKFSTHKDGEYIVVRVDSHCIKGVIE
jgi:RNA:NAD 2'-phosphotransferase (TPT1/KptA family)